MRSIRSKSTQIVVKELVVDVLHKNVKNVNLCVYPPNGTVRVSVPKRMALGAIEDFLATKIDWIRKKQEKIFSQVRESPKMFVDGETHLFNGNSYTLKIVELRATPKVEFKQGMLELQIRPGASQDKRQFLLDSWYRQQLKISIPTIINKHEKRMGVEVSSFGIKRMKSRWGTCNTRSKRIWLNLELAKRPTESLEYLVVHEMVHLLERNHNQRFKSLMDQYLPDWRSCKDQLNQFPLR